MLIVWLSQLLSLPLQIMRYLKKSLIISVAMILTMSAYAGINPQTTYINNGVEETVWKNISGDAPLHVTFTSGATDLETNSTIEWHISHRTSGTSLTRYEDEFEFEFTEAGINDVALYLRENNEIIDSAKIEITISESRLEMPNAFSPNDDGNNDFYGAKGCKINKNENSTSKYRSIVEFHAYIFNRWGQKLYEWTDIDGGWDGTYNGQPVKEGVYFVLVKARGADGREYNIRRDVNLIRRFNEGVSSGGGGYE